MITVPLYNTERLREAQEADYETLCAIDRLCRDNGITYLLDSGTLLGAVRHQGFIPWDDDMDIAMTRENYEKFRSVAGNLPEEFELLEPAVFAKENRFYDFTPRVIYRNSKMRLWSEEQDFYGGRLNHLWVDIFILDGIPDGKIADFFTRFRQKVLYGFAMSKRFSLDMEKYKGKEKLFVKILTGLGRKMSMEKILARQERLSVKWNRKKTGRLYYSNYQPDYLHCTVQREWSERTVELPFEGGTFLCPEGYDQVLREVYGDYMTLPPEEKRVPTHSDEIEIYRNGQPAPVVFR